MPISLRMLTAACRLGVGHAIGAHVPTAMTLREAIVADVGSEGTVSPSSTRRLTEVHLIAARERALRLFAMTSTIFPEEWASREIVELTVTDASELAYHARRVIDLCGFHKRSFDLVDQTRFGLNPGQDITFVSDLHDALNRLHHAREFKFHWAILNQPKKIYLASQKELVVSFLEIGTDYRKMANISLFGVAISFLNSVIRAVKDEFPKYQF